MTHPHGQMAYVAPDTLTDLECLTKYGGYTRYKADDTRIVVAPVSSTGLKPHYTPTHRIIVAYGYDKDGFPTGYETHREAALLALSSLPPKVGDEMLAHQAEGGWLNGRGEVVVESCLVIAGYYTTYDECKGYAKTLGEVFRQEQTLLIHVNANAEFIDV